MHSTVVAGNSIRAREGIHTLVYVGATRFTIVFGGAATISGTRAGDHFMNNLLGFLFDYPIGFI